MKVVALQLHIIHSNTQLEHHPHNILTSDLTFTWNAQERRSLGLGLNVNTEGVAPDC